MRQPSSTPDVPNLVRRSSFYSSASMSSFLDVGVGEEEAEEENGQVSTKMSPSKN